MTHIVLKCVEEHVTHILLNCGEEHVTHILLKCGEEHVTHILLNCVEGACNTYFSSLIKLQKYAIRLIMSAPYRVHTDQLFKKLLILPLRKIYEYTVVLFMYKIVKNIFPSVMTSMFNRNDEIHKYRTRHAELLHVPISKSNVL